MNPSAGRSQPSLVEGRASNLSCRLVRVGQLGQHGQHLPGMARSSKRMRIRPTDSRWWVAARESSVEGETSGVCGCGGVDLALKWACVLHEQQPPVHGQRRAPLGGRAPSGREGHQRGGQPLMLLHLLVRGRACGELRQRALQRFQLCSPPVPTSVVIASARACEPARMDRASKSIASNRCAKAARPRWRSAVREGGWDGRISHRERPLAAQRRAPDKRAS